MLLKSAARVSSDLRAVDSEVERTVRVILADVRKRGLAAIRHYARTLDHHEPESFRLSDRDIEAIMTQVPPEVVEDVAFAQEQIRRFALVQRDALRDVESEPFPGVVLGHRNIPVDSAACYVPGGRYPLLASAHMGIVTAKAAGVRRVVALTPPTAGRPHPATIAAMKMAGADEIWLIGGAQALAAAAYGIEGLDPVDMIVGPGNAYVAEAKRQLFGEVGIDLLAGPTEVLVIADESADPETVAVDLLGQAEHGPDSVAILLTTSHELAVEVLAEIERQLETLETADVARRAWHDCGEVIVVADEDALIREADRIASEHVEVLTREPERFLAHMTNYGALFLGEMTNVAYGDKVIGTNHVLPTRRAARYTGGLWVGKFLKTCTYQRITNAASSAFIGRYGSRLCAIENFAGHKRQNDLRVERYGNAPRSAWRRTVTIK
jgi:sulfopropanediol 3-dehydrogenase